MTHGTEYSYGRGCRCGECRRAAAEARAARRAGRGPGKTPKGQVAHSLHGYKFHGCRCETCRAANAASHRRWYARNVA